jgi:OOP family OmpA-OmpF porin
LFHQAFKTKSCEESKIPLVKASNFSIGDLRDQGARALGRMRSGADQVVYHRARATRASKGSGHVRTELRIFAFAAAAFTIGPAAAQGYVTDARGAAVKGPYGACLRTGYWTPALASTECDPALVPKPAPMAAAAPPPPPPPAVAPPPPPPPPPPVVAAPPPPPKPKRCDAVVAMRTDEAFAFGKTTLESPAMRARIEGEVRSRLAACGALEAVIIEGHTDRIGDPIANQKLSERRAEAAKSVLVDMGVPADKIETLGMGKTLPVKSCPDAEYKTQQALIECLAPNRRIVINIRGVGK